MNIKENKHDNSTDVATRSGWNFIIDEITIVFAAIGALESRIRAWCSGVSYHFSTNLSSIMNVYITTGKTMNFEKKAAAVNL